MRETIHDGSPTLCVGDAAFIYVNAFKAYASIGFFHGAALADPAHLLEGAGKRMRHVKLRAREPVNEKALTKLISAAYADIKKRLGEDPMDQPLAKKATAANSAKSADWRVARLDALRAVIMSAAPGVIETRKWKKPSNPAGVPVWEKDGIICTGETYKDKIKLTFASGAALADPSALFNSSLDGKERRAIDIFEGDALNKTALKALVRAAVKFNASKQA